jgi:hypothetical protein
MKKIDKKGLQNVVALVGFEPNGQIKLQIHAAYIKNPVSLKL